MLAALAFITTTGVTLKQVKELKNEVKLLKIKVEFLEEQKTRTKQFIISNKINKRVQEDFYRILSSINQNQLPKKILFQNNMLYVQNLEALKSSSFMDLLALLLNEDLFVSIEIQKKIFTPTFKRALLEMGIDPYSMKAVEALQSPSAQSLIFTVITLKPFNK